MQRARDVTDTAMAMGGVGPFGGRGVSVLPDGTISAGGNSVGRVKYNHSDQMTRIADIQVDPSYQNQGIGTAAIKQIQDEAAARGNPVVLSTDAFRGKQAQADQLRLYQRLGFSPNTGPDAVSERIGGKKVAEQLVWRPPEATPSPEATPDVAPPPSFTAYHGSPHAFDQFDLSKIGTGEGAQAYGHGAYLADAEPVAKGYRDALAGQASPAYQAAEKEFNDAHYNFDGSAAARARIDAAEAALADARQANPGHMYEVQVNADPAHFLDWDKPLSEQHPVVREALTKLGIAPKYAPATEGQLRPVEDQIEAALKGTPLEFAGRTIAVDASHDIGKWDLASIRGSLDPAAAEKWDAALGNLNELVSPNKPEAWAHLTGQDAHQMITDMQEPGIGEGIQQALGKSTARDVAASQALQQAGIPGIRYLDAGSRGAGEGSRNSVVFDANTMDIIRRYGLAGLMAGGGAAAGLQQTGDQDAAR
jgi:GNAT superfamily N-acetyltransferase